MFFNKKKTADAASPAAKKASIGKKAERGFFHVFNDKSRGRRIMFSAAFVCLPASMAMGLMEKDPADAQGTKGPQHVQQYQNEISSLVRDSHSIRINAEGLPASSIDAARDAELNQRANALAQRLILDSEISERDAQRLARQFLRDMQDHTVMRAVQHTYAKLQKNSAYLFEAREKTGIHDVTTATGAKADQVLSSAASQSGGDYMWHLFMVYGLMFGVFDGALSAALRAGRRRDDELKQEQRTDNFRDAKSELDSLLTPKNKPGASTPRR